MQVSHGYGVGNRGKPGTGGYLVGKVVVQSRGVR